MALTPVHTARSADSRTPPCDSLGSGSPAFHNAHVSARPALTIHGRGTWWQVSIAADTSDEINITRMLIEHVFYINSDGVEPRNHSIKYHMTEWNVCVFVFFDEVAGCRLQLSKTFNQLHI